MLKICPKAVKFAIAESIGQLLILRPHPSAQGKHADKGRNATNAMPQTILLNVYKETIHWYVARK